MGRSYDQSMTTREKVISLLNDLSQEQLEAEYEHLLTVSKPAAVTDAEFAEGLDRLVALSERLNVSTDATQLIRDERDWLANRVP